MKCRSSVFSALVYYNRNPQGFYCFALLSRCCLQLFCLVGFFMRFICLRPGSLLNWMGPDGGSGLQRRAALYCGLLNRVFVLTLPRRPVQREQWGPVHCKPTTARESSRAAHNGQRHTLLFCFLCEDWLWFTRRFCFFLYFWQTWVNVFLNVVQNVR